jgi:acetyl-CoA acetyltransferase family protein
VQEALVLDAVRTPMGRYRGALSGVRPDDLAAHTIAAVVERNGVDPEQVTDVYFGAANQAGEDNRDVARMAALLAGLPVSVPGATVNRLCASGLEAVNMAARAVKLGEGDLYLAGGVESMSRAPWVVPKPEDGLPRGEQTMYDTTLGWRMVNQRMAELYSTESMGETGENVAERYGVTRDDQDSFALRSHRRSVTATEDGRFAEEIVAVELPEGGQIERDEGPRPDTSLEKLAKLRPAFREGGTVTAANSSSISDGAAALVLMRASEARRRQLEPIGWIVGTAGVAQAPAWFTTAPVFAIRKLLEQVGWRAGDVGLYEINEAFAVVSMAAMRDLELPHEKVNVHGGACALGHPIGASGARILVTLLAAMEKYGQRRGVASLCIGGGEATAVAVERAA